PAARAPAVPRADDAAVDEALVMTLPPPPDRYFARGRVRLVAGWQAVAQLGGDGDRKAEGEGDGGPTLPPLAEGQRLDGKWEVLTKQTRPPPRHTEATLLGAMESAGRDIADEDLRAAMRDSGLGTPATRASTIETLIRRTFVQRDGKNLVPTDMGIALIDALPVKSLASPELTGQWEARLSRVARGEETRDAFMADISRYVSDVVTAIRGGAGIVKATPVSRAAAPAPPVPAPRAAKPTSKPRGSKPASTKPAPAPLVCPRCHEGTLVAGKRGWGCSRWRQGCAVVIWFDVAGRRISDAELGELVAKGKTRRRKWKGRDGAEVSGRLVLDLGAARDAGAARVELGA
ncbi:MAG: topB: topoisomerase, partial [Myxococcales bacterium]|nr:topB: topoisomerase [Myxococcales bacterium]